MEYIIEGACIECNKAQIISRDIKRSSLIDYPKIGVCTKYNCKLNSEAHILTPLSPKRHIYNPNSRLDVGDSIRSQDLFFLISQSTSIASEVIPFTGRHKAQKCDTNGYTYAEITLKFPNIPVIKDPAQLKALQPYEEIKPEPKKKKR